MDKNRPAAFFEETAAGRILHVRASACGMCPRYLWEVARGAKTAPMTAAQKMDVEFGSFIHEKLQKEFGEKGLAHSFEKEVSLQLTPDITIEGHVDGIWKDGSLLEIKTIAPYGFKKVMENRQIKEEHRYQAAVYLKALRLDRAVFVYVPKFDKSVPSIFPCPQEMAELSFSYNGDFLLEEIKTRLQMVLSPEPPRRLSGRDVRFPLDGEPTDLIEFPWQCTWCPVVSKCRPDALPAVKVSSRDECKKCGNRPYKGANLYTAPKSVGPYDTYTLVERR
jgi:CRISPR/Cas system-associated exonuclease Cas4 (RecB family)